MRCQPVNAYAGEYDRHSSERAEHERDESRLRVTEVAQIVCECTDVSNHDGSVRRPYLLFQEGDRRYRRANRSDQKRSTIRTRHGGWNVYGGHRRILNAAILGVSYDADDFE